MTRYALYFTPAPDSSWWQAGCSWLGRDPARNIECSRPAIVNVPVDILNRLTEEARRYGFHATLKAPFHLANGFTETHVNAMADAFCAVQQPIILHDVKVRPLGEFLALRPAGPVQDICALATRCLDYFDLLRKLPDAEELDEHRRVGLSEREEALLQRWGYPYVEEKFRFHLTLTGPLAGLPSDAALAVKSAAQACFATAQAAEPLVIDGLSLFKEEHPGEPYVLLRRISFGARPPANLLPPRGKLFYIVGPSGVGKDTLIQWAQQRVGARQRVVFAQRISTRPEASSSAQDFVDRETFLRLEKSGHFAMTWSAHGFFYGIPRSIEADLAIGCNVVVNGSREYLPQLRRQFPGTRVIWIDADAALIRQRIEARRRESGIALRSRLERTSRFPRPDSQEIIHIDNSGPPGIAGQRLLQILEDESKANLNT
ncbi:phosphonate metabolism protein/1,5-bisphosphokinase (PRPP-forming) PhnN [Noviherbaspirillum massiliense]|uniref:phosphonate metabolism protein/1,5-bisphosphokinase (PRPP-forming) PhnN n=1 Tax=Noviherbaspirillum massiliense TaxID=1465823 RepID=UPI000304DACA|nr:phosphonate metabolism protein/1,5-bisphosphokinase (PRPP-forming) PhnN [Noviherbaspirillum massiliense]